MLFAVSAGVLMLAGMFTLMTTVVYGFIAFGLVFVGMMCVLPGQVADPAAGQVKFAATKKQPRGATEKLGAGSRMHVPAGIRSH